MPKYIELNQVQDPVYKDRTIAGIQVKSKILVDFFSEEGSDLVPLEDLTAEQLRALVLAMAQTYPEE